MLTIVEPFTGAISSTKAPKEDGLLINEFAVSAPANLPVVAALYSQLAGVLAGFGFAGLIALIAAQFTSGHSAGRSLESGAPLLASFVALAVSSLNYAVVAGETPGTARVAALQTISGLGFSVAGLMLLYSILVLVRGLERDSPRTRAVSRAMGDLIRAVIVLGVAPLVVLLMWSGARDHAIQKYGADVGFTGLDWGAASVLAVVLVTGWFFALQFFKKPRYRLSAIRFISGVTVVLASVSMLGAAVLISFTDSSTVVPDPVPLAAIVLVGGFAVLAMYSAGRFTAAPDEPDTVELEATAQAPEDGSELRVQVDSRWRYRLSKAWRWLKEAVDDNTHSIVLGTLAIGTASATLIVKRANRTKNSKKPQGQEGQSHTGLASPKRVNRQRAEGRRRN